MRQLTVVVEATDPVTRAGIQAQFRGVRDVDVIDDGDGTASVALVCTEEVDDDTLRRIRARRCSSSAVVLMAADFDVRSAMNAIEAGATALLRRATADPSELRRAIISAHRAEGTVPPDLLGPLLERVRSVQTSVLSPRGLHFSGLSDRETAVLRLVADGHDTREIASQLAYSERTIKNVIQDVIRRFGLRNRSHAVAYVLRNGML